ncbi:CLUMA_CG016129, isoform A [Clunio marinus]|uniref:CLUMA_CG016129, isoform A n=1 Tax=Clunio marinus TaxID=568069 RepID=A0A1J1IQQ7_9DIPT|nr:CLUMA_CG016129, isoform A [Clunio marinus]
MKCYEIIRAKNIDFHTSNDSLCFIELICCQFLERFRYDMTYFAKININIYRRSGGDYYNNILELKDIDICHIIKGADTISFVTEFLDYGKTLNGTMKQSCLRSGEFYLANASVPGDYKSLDYFPSGLYKLAIKVFDLKDENVFNITLSANVIHK